MDPLRAILKDELDAVNVKIEKTNNGEALQKLRGYKRRVVKALKTKSYEK